MVEKIFKDDNKWTITCTNNHKYKSDTVIAGPSLNGLAIFT